METIVFGGGWWGWGAVEGLKGAAEQLNSSNTRLPKTCERKAPPFFGALSSISAKSRGKHHVHPPTSKSMSSMYKHVMFISCRFIYMFKVMSCHVTYLDSRVTITCVPCQDTVCCNGQLEIQEMKSSNSLDDATEKWRWLQPCRPVVTSTKSGLALAMYSPACSWTGKHVWFQKVLKHHETSLYTLIFDWSLTILGSLMYFSQSSLNRLVLKHSGILFWRDAEGA